MVGDLTTPAAISAGDWLRRITMPQPTGQDTWVVSAGEGPIGADFGGCLMASMAGAAWQSVNAGLRLDGVTAHFLRPARSDTDLELSVDRDFDGRSSAVRRVVASQRGVPVGLGTMRFAPARGDHPGNATDGRVDAVAQPGAPHRVGAIPDGLLELWHHDDRDADSPDVRVGRRLWFRCGSGMHLGSVPAEHLVLLASDLYFCEPMLWAAPRPAASRCATISHSVWFTAPVDPSRWNVLESGVPAGLEGTGQVHGRLLDPDGRPLATVVQQATPVRPRRR